MTLELGEHSYAGTVNIRCWTAKDVIVKVGKFCSLGSFDIIIDGNHNLNTFSTYPFKLKFGFDEAPNDNWGKFIPEIGNDVWIANDVTLYSGVNVGNGAVIVGRSVVTKSVPDYAIVGGNPAKLIRYRFESDVISKFLEYKWWDLSLDQIRTLITPDDNNISMVLEKLKNIRDLSKKEEKE